MAQEEHAVPEGRSRSSSSCSSFDDSYFYQNYVPLSNLPTPPLMCSSATTTRPSSQLIFPDGPLMPALLGPAIHLTNLIPAPTSLITPSTTAVHAILTRAALPIEILALAACILDSLTTRFSLTWRLSCPLNTPVSASASPQQRHIDNVNPELIVLSAMILSSQFLDDLASHTRAYARDWGYNQWSCEQINFTQRCLLQNIGYSLLPLCKDSVIRDAVRDMERAARRSDVVLYDSSRECHGEANTKVEGRGKAVLGAGAELTPAETPTCEKTCIPFMPLERFNGRWEFCDDETNPCG